MGKDAKQDKKTTQPVRYVHPPPSTNASIINYIYRLYTKAVFTGFKRGKTTQAEQFALLKVKGVNEQKAASFYFGKRVAYIFKGKSVRNNTKFRVIWGRITKSHGNNGLVRAQFAKNLPPRAMGATLRVMLYPNRSI